MFVFNYSTCKGYELFRLNKLREIMFDIDIYNFYSVAPSVAIIVASIAMVVYGVYFIRKEIAKDSEKAKSE